MENIKKILYAGSNSEIIEKKSRFIATIASVKTDKEATEFIADIKKKYWDARHNCFAYVVGKDLQRFSDDGEPNGTAGKPMLDILVSQNIQDICVVVTRYFGGVLLGTGGLVRAYQKAVTQGLLLCQLIEPLEGEIIKIKTNYSNADKIKHVMEKMEIFQKQIEYTEGVIIEVVVNLEIKDLFLEKITEATGKKQMVASDGVCKFAIYDSKLLLFWRRSFSHVMI